jgi:hypothetical protein
MNPPPRGDLYVEDETELALLPTLTRCWTRRGAAEDPGPGDQSQTAPLCRRGLAQRRDDPPVR